MSKIQYLILSFSLWTISCTRSIAPHMNETTITKKVQFSQDPATVWDLLTNPEKTKLYMFGSEIQSNWEDGSELNWTSRTEEGTSNLIIKGSILKIKKYEILTYTMLVPSSGMDDIPDNYIKTAYKLETTDEGTELTITQWGFDKAEDGQKRYESSLKGWDLVIPLMKKVIQL